MKPAILRALYVFRGFSHKCVRFLFLRTNPYWPFNKLNRATYYVFLETFLFFIKRMSEVKAVYLRHGMASGLWIPGDSDIDMTVVIQNMPPEHEIKFLHRLFGFYIPLRAVFPLINAVFINEKEFSQEKLVEKLFDSVYPIQGWRLLYGVDCRKKYSPEFRYPLTQKFILWYSQKLFADLFAQNLKKQNYVRSYCKYFLKLIQAAYAIKNSNAPESEKQPLEYFRNTELVKKLHIIRESDYWSEDPEEFILSETYYILNILDESFRQILPKESVSGLLDVTLSKREETKLQNDIRKSIISSPIKDHLESVILCPKPFQEKNHWLYIIAEKNLSYDNFREIISWIKKNRDFMEKLNTTPLIFTENILRGYVHFLGGDCALEYSHLIENGVLVYGKDVREEILPPRGEYIDRKISEILFNDAVHKIRFALVGRFLKNSNSTLSETIYEIMSYRLFMEKGIIATNPEKISQEYASNYGNESKIDEKKTAELYVYAKYIIDRVLWHNAQES